MPALCQLFLIPAVILTPTRELATQITKDSKKFTKSLGLEVVAVYGGTGISEQIAQLKKGAEIIVCTPGRMIDMLAANSGKLGLAYCLWWVRPSYSTTLILHTLALIKNWSYTGCKRNHL